MSELEFLKMGWRFDNTYVNLPKIMLTRLDPVPVKSPKLVIINRKLSEDLGLDFTYVGKVKLAQFFSGISLLTTYFTGPLGLVLYWFVRTLYSKKINFYD